jgi:hypothetical protein
MELVPVLSDKWNISTKQSVYQNIYFILRPYFVQNKYVPHTNNSSPLPPGGAPQFHNLWYILI